MNKLLSNLPKNQKLSFFTPDDAQSFFKNVKKNKDWIYVKKQILYSFNEHGFREKSFDKIDWQNSIVILGCSHVQGVGLAEEDTVSTQLEKIMQMPVVNLGISASGVDLACWNSLTLHDHYPHPKAIVQIWSSLHRYSDNNSDDWLRTYLPMNGHDYITNLNWEYRSTRYVQSDRALWKNKVAYYEASFFHETAEVLGIDYFEYKNDARDLIHPGIESARKAAETIAENLEQKIKKDKKRC